MSDLAQWAADAGVELSADFILDYERLVATARVIAPAREIAPRPPAKFEARKIAIRKLDMED